MELKEHWLDDYYACKNKIIDSNFENFLGYKKLFKLVFDASNDLEIDEYKRFCNKIGLNPFEAKSYYMVYDKFFRSCIAEYKISDELAKRAKNWDKTIWIEFAGVYSDDLACRKALFYTLISGKLKYGNVAVSVEEIKLKDIRKYKYFVKKYSHNKTKNIYSKFKSIRTRLNNFINKDFKNYAKADNELLNTLKMHNSNIMALIEEHIQNLDEKELPKEEVEITNDSAPPEEETPADDWESSISKYVSSEIYKLYEQGDQLKVNWENPYYAVIFLGLDVFNLPTAEEYRKRYKELVLLFHPDTKEEAKKPVANLLFTILNNINLNTWGINGERYLKFINSIKFSLIKLGL